MFRCKAVAFAALALLASAPYASAVPGDLITTIDPPTSTTFFGSRIVATTQQLLVKAFQDTAQTTESGMVAFYNRNFDFLKTITAPVPQSFDNFGSPIVISGQSLYIGNTEDNSDGVTESGALYKFKLRDGAFQNTFVNPDPQVADFFGFYAAATSRYIAIGATGDSTIALDAGAVYLYDARSRSLLLALFPSRTLPEQWFGDYLTFSGNRLLVGADGATDFAPGAGSIYVIDPRTGQVVQSIESPEPQEGAYFGYPIILGQRVIVTAADGQDDGATDAGTVYVLDSKTLSLVRTIRNPSPGEADRFGQAMAVKGRLLLIGAPGSSIDGPGNGIAYLYDVNTGGILLTLHNPEPVSDGGGAFGCSVQFMGTSLVVGARGDVMIDPESRGNVFVFEGPRR